MTYVLVFSRAKVSRERNIGSIYLELPLELPGPDMKEGHVQTGQRWRTLALSPEEPEHRFLDYVMGGSNKKNEKKNLKMVNSNNSLITHSQGNRHWPNICFG